MKMRKILSFVLVLSLVLGSFSMAFAATPSTGLSDIAGIANEDAIQVNNDLGIIKGFPDGTFLPEKAVTRAEFAAMITRALAVPESALAGYTSTTFKDTAGYGWAVPYLAFAQSKGIMIGDGMGNAMPGRTINVNEAMTMVLRAIGYVNHSAELVGTWPSNYVTVAQNVGLYDDVAAVLTVDRANAAQIIYNALTVQKVAVNADGDTRYLTLTGSTEAAVLLNTGLGCTTVANATLGVTAGVKIDDSDINIIKNFGAFGTAYTKDDKVVAFTKKSTVLTGEVDGSYFKVGNVKYSFQTGTPSTLTPAAYVNTSYAGVATSIGAFAAAADSDISLNVDLSGKTIKTVYNMVAWNDSNAKVIKAADLEDLKDNKLMSYTIPDDFNDEPDYTKFLLKGADSLDKIKKDDVVGVYADNGTVRMITVGTKVVSGKVTEESSTNVWVDGVKYSKSKLTGASTLPTLDQDVKMSLDFDGKVYTTDATGGTADLYGIAHVYSSGGTLDADRVKIFTADDTNKVFDLTDMTDSKEFTFVGTITNNAAGAAVIQAASNTAIKLIGYALDKDGAIDTANVGVATNATFTLNNKSFMTIGTTSYKIASDIVVFTATGSGATLDLNLSSIGNLALGPIDQSTVSAQAIIVDDEIKALLVDAIEDDQTGDDMYAVFNSKSSIKVGNDTVTKLVGLVDGADYTNTYNGTVTLTDYTVYKVVLSGDGTIKTLTPYATTSALQAYASGMTITQAGVDGMTFTFNDGTKATASSDVVVYEAVQKVNNGGLDKYVKSSITSIGSNDIVYMFETRTGTDIKGTANIVIFINK